MEKINRRQSREVFLATCLLDSLKDESYRFDSFGIVFVVLFACDRRQIKSFICVYLQEHQNVIVSTPRQSEFYHTRV